MMAFKTRDWRCSSEWTMHRVLASVANTSKRRNHKNLKQIFRSRHLADVSLQTMAYLKLTLCWFRALFSHPDCFVYGAMLVLRLGKKIGWKEVPLMTFSFGVTVASLWSWLAAAWVLYWAADLKIQNTKHQQLNRTLSGWKLKRSEFKIVVEKNKQFSGGSALNWGEVKPELLSGEVAEWSVCFIWIPPGILSLLRNTKNLTRLSFGTLWCKGAITIPHERLLSLMGTSTTQKVT